MDSIRSRLLLDSLDFTPASISGLVAWYDTSLPAYLVSNPVGAAPGSGVSVLYNRAVSSRTGNLLVQSEDFSTTWARTRVNAFGATDTGALGAGSFANTARTTDPLGGNTADFVQEDGTAGNDHRVGQTFASFVLGVSYTFYVIAKADARTGIALELPSACFGTQLGKYNLSTGAYAIRNGTPVVSMVSLGAGWYLCGIQATATAAGSGACNVVLSSNDGTTTIYNGDNTSGLFFWCASLVRSDMTPVTGPTLAQGYYRTTTVSHDPIHDLLQATAASQGQLSRRDRKGNWLKQSSDFSTTWTRVKINAFGATDTGAAGAGSFANTSRTTDPLGGNTADFIQEDGTASDTHYFVQNATVGAGRFTNYCFVKPGGRDWVRLRYGVGSDIVQGWFNVGAGVGAVGTVSTGGSAASAVGAIMTHPSWNGFYLCALSGTFPTGGTMSCYTFIETADTVTTYNGDNTSGLFLWGASLTQSTWDQVTGPTEAQGYVATTTLPAFPGQNGLQILRADGSDDYWKTLQFQLAQPTTVVWFGREVTWTLNDRIIDGYAAVSGTIYQGGTTPELYAYAGSVSPAITNVSIGSFVVATAVFNGASSLFKIGNGTAVTGNFGASSMNGITLGAAATPAQYFNGDIGEVCIFNRALDASEIGKLVAYGARKWGFTA